MPFAPASPRSRRATPAGPARRTCRPPLSGLRGRGGSVIDGSIDGRGVAAEPRAQLIPASALFCARKHANGGGGLVPYQPWVTLVEVDEVFQGGPSPPDSPTTLSIPAPERKPINDATASARRLVRPALESVAALPGGHPRDTGRYIRQDRHRCQRGSCGRLHSA